ncbi:hypothetical protein RclHR1_00800009 [Rhizophagus clarus]|nr:hypothetical protein RclHR1_00800009 [Rhizophagus clarus]
MFRNYLKGIFDGLANYRCIFAIELSCTIESMHKTGIVHEDLNSNNMLVDRVSIKISDFGRQSRRFKDQSSHDTLPYDAPEGFFNVTGEKSQKLEQIEKLKKCNVCRVGELL